MSSVGFIACGGDDGPTPRGDDVITYEAASLAAGTVGTAYNQSVATALLNGEPAVGIITYALKDGDTLPDGLTITTAGAITGTPEDGSAVTGHTFRVIANAPTAESVEAQWTITINDPGLPNVVYVADPALLPSGTAGTPYTGSVGSATVPATGITYAITTGSLPSPLVLNASTGAVTGTPAAAATVNFTVTASADGYQSATANWTLTITAAVDPDVVYVANPALLPAGTAGVQYEGSVASATVPASGVTYASTNAPSWLTVNSNGSVSGMPPATGSFEFAVTASATGYNPATANWTLTISSQPALVFPNTPLLTHGTINASYTGSVATVTTPATGVIYALATGSSLPAGLELAANGAITGAPTALADHLEFSVIASASGYQSTTTVWTITIGSLPAMNYPTTPPLGLGNVAVSYNGSVATITGVTGVAYALATDSTLPAGLELAASGAITGTPTAQVANHSFTVIATAAGYQDAEAVWTITIGRNPAEYDLEADPVKYKVIIGSYELGPLVEGVVLTFAEPVDGASFDETTFRVRVANTARTVTSAYVSDERGNAIQGTSSRYITIKLQLAVANNGSAQQSAGAFQFVMSPVMSNIWQPNLRQYQVDVNAGKTFKVGDNLYNEFNLLNAGLPFV